MQPITLVVDDVPEIRTILDRELTRVGYDVRLASDSVSALATLWGLQGGVDVVLTDIHMPGIDGLRFAQKVRLAWPRIPIVMMSGYIDPILQEQSAALMVPIVAKPFRLTTLLDILHTARLDR